MRAHEEAAVKATKEAEKPAAEVTNTAETKKLGRN